MAGNSPFRGIVFCNLGTSKTVISKFVTTANIVTPYFPPYGHPNDVPVGQKIRLYFSKSDIEISGGREKKTGQTVIRIVHERADYEKIRRD